MNKYCEIGLLLMLIKKKKVIILHPLIMHTKSYCKVLPFLSIFVIAYGHGQQVVQII